MRYVLMLILALPFAGCTLVPRQVEYFRAHVQPLPERGEAADESVRQAARLAADRALATEHAAVETAASSEVISPARETVALTETVSNQLGPPSERWRDDVEALIERIDREDARYRARLATYADETRENAGKPIEGTGAIQIGYFTNLFIIAAVLFCGWIVLRVIFAPAVSGVRGVTASGRLLTRALTEVVDGGQAFKQAIQKQFAGNEEVRDLVLKTFGQSHRASQSRETQTAVREVKGKP